MENKSRIPGTVAKRPRDAATITANLSIGQQLGLLGIS